MVIILRWCLSVFTLIGVILFTFGNREPVSLVLSPVHDPVQTYSFVLGLGGLCVGFILGGFMVWLNEAKTRQKGRDQRKTIKKLEKELQTANENKKPSPYQKLIGKHDKVRTS